MGGGVRCWSLAWFPVQRPGKGKGHGEGVVRFLALQADLPGTELRVQPLITPALSGRPFKDLRRCKHSRGLTKASAPPFLLRHLQQRAPLLLSFYFNPSFVVNESLPKWLITRFDVGVGSGNSFQTRLKHKLVVCLSIGSFHNPFKNQLHHPSVSFTQRKKDTHTHSLRTGAWSVPLVLRLINVPRQHHFHHKATLHTLMSFSSCSAGKALHSLFKRLFMRTLRTYSVSPTE